MLYVSSTGFQMHILDSSAFYLGTDFLNIQITWLDHIEAVEFDLLK